MTGTFVIDITGNCIGVALMDLIEIQYLSLWTYPRSKKRERAHQKLRPIGNGEPGLQNSVEY